ncbi:MAG: two pore domain potassium channel family protein [Armatimonadetes bacterium]|nr:two pore domain potassium channel family protein [Armatimonadota bacterium]
MQGMETPAIIAGAILLLTVLWDAFETMVLPRSAGTDLRLTRFFFVSTWLFWRFLSTRLSYKNPIRQAMLGIYGPLSLILLITLWSNLLILSFGLLLFGVGSSEATRLQIESGGFGDYLYLSGVTLFTLGYGDETPGVPLTKALCVLEAGVGFGILAMVIGYLPALYQTFARRETMVLRLYARTGHPATSHKLVEKYGAVGAWKSLETVLSEWENWGAELLESHRSYPILSFYRSQTEEDSWLATAVILCDVYDVIEEQCPENALDRGALLLQAEATRNIIADGLSDLVNILNLKGEQAPAMKLSRYLLLALPPGLPACVKDTADTSVE